MQVSGEENSEQLFAYNPLCDLAYVQKHIYEHRRYI